MANIFPSLQYRSLSDVSEQRPTLLVTSTSASVHEKELLHVNVVIKEIVTTTVWCRLQKSMPDVAVETVLALGGGSVMDVAKLRGAQLAAEVICVPTLLSTDAFFTSTAAVRQDGHVRYLPTDAASAVVIDDGLLAKAAPQLQALGCCDVLSILTASEDWRRDSTSSLSGPAIRTALKICERLLEAEEEIAAGSAAGRNAILAALRGEVELCAGCGSDRVEEGSEHYFAYALERHAPDLMHGAMVGLGILFAASLQGQPIERLRRFIDATGISRSWRSISRDALVGTLLGMAAFVREERYPASVWNSVALKAGDAAALCDLVLGGVPA